MGSSAGARLITMRSCGRVKVRIDHGPVQSMAALPHRRFGQPDQNGLGHGGRGDVDFHLHAPRIDAQQRKGMTAEADTLLSDI